METIALSPLGHTWILDLDGTIVKHNGYLADGHDTFLPGAEAFLAGLPEADMVVFLTSRTEDVKALTEGFLRQNGVRFDHIVFGAPYGERILLNDKKPSGLATGIAVNTERDVFCKAKFVVDESL